MREFSQKISNEAFTNGLRPERYVSKNSAFFSELKNCKIGKAGFQVKPELVQPLDVDVSWPFPQLIRLEREWILAEQNILKLIDVNTGDYEIVYETIEGLTFHYADFYDYVVLTNGQEVITRDLNGGYKNSDLPLFKTCCNFKGQLFVGNLSDFYEADETYVAWSRIGEANFEPDEKNEAGRAPTRVGEIYNVLPLGNSVIVYGADGIDIFSPLGKPSPSFGKAHLASFGIASRDAVAGDGKRHLFLDDKGELWLLDGEMNLNRLGYEEFFKPMIGNQIIISNISNTNDFYISNGEITYLFSQGLSQVSEIPTSIEFYQGANYAIFKTDNDQEFRFSTVPYDFGQRNIKKITVLEFSFDSDSEFFAAVDWRMDSYKDFRSTKWQRVTPLGVAYVGVQGTEFRVKGKSSGFINLDNIAMKIQFNDRRFNRGTQNVD